MKRGHFYFILFVLIITHGTFYFLGMNFERTNHEKEIDLSMKASYQTYKNSEENGTGKFDYYGNTREKTDTTRPVLQETSRTEIAKPTTGSDKKQNSHTRKRNY